MPLIFLWDSVKACHAILLTNIEADRISWNETENLDQIRSAHAQRHVNTAINIVVSSIIDGRPLSTAAH